MGTRSTPASVGADRSRRIVAELTTELRRARVDRGLSQVEVGRAVQLDGSQVCRIECGLSPDVSIAVLCRLLAVVGLELSPRAYPAGEPIRDRVHVALLGSFRRRLHCALAWCTEVPFPAAGDLRAWDGRVATAGESASMRKPARPVSRLHDIRPVHQVITGTGGLVAIGSGEHLVTRMAARRSNGACRDARWESWGSPPVGVRIQCTPKPPRLQRHV